MRGRALPALALAVLSGIAPARTARAAAPALEAVLFPSAPLQADGQAVHLLRLYLLEGDALERRLPSLSVARGSIIASPRASADGGVEIRYRPPRVSSDATDTLSVSLHGARVLAVPILLTPVGRLRLSVTLSPDPLILARGARAEVHVHVRDAAGRPRSAALRLGASVGRVSPPVEREPGEYQALFLAPEEKYPQVAIVGALSVEDGAFAAAPCRLAARVTVPGQGEPGAQMRLVVDGKSFGPVTVAADGTFSIPIVVPPGGHAVGVSTDKLGNEREREIDLALPPFPRLLLATVPPELPADGAARAALMAFAVDGRGGLERGRAPALAADRGSLSPPEAREGGAVGWTYTAPGEIGPGYATLRAGGLTARIALRPAPPFHLELVPLEGALGAGSDSPATVRLRVRDAAGSAVEGAHLQATLAGGRVLGVSERGRGEYALELVPPRDPGRGAARLHVELGGVEAGAPRRVTLHPVRAAVEQVAAEAWIDDDLGLPVSGALVELGGPSGAIQRASDHYGTARFEFPTPKTRRFRVTAQLLGLPAATLDFLRVGGVLHAAPSVAGHGVLDPGAEQTPPGASLEADLPLRPAAPVDLVVTVEPEHSGRALRVHVAAARADGKPLEGALLYQASAGRLDVLKPVDPSGHGELRFTPPDHARSGTRFLVSVTDPKSRVSVFTEVVAP